MITKDQNLALLTVGNSAKNNSAWLDYANYCFKREKGLRDEAFKHLDDFLTSAKRWTFSEKIDFVKFLFSFFESVLDADYGPFPQPLSDRLIKATLRSWCDVEQTDSSPFRWFGKYYRSEGHLFRALEINPGDDLARIAILRWWIHDIYFSVHHLPEGYLGHPLDDLKLGDKIEGQICKLSTHELRKYWGGELGKSIGLVRNYVDWKASGNPDFEKWGLENNKQTSYNSKRDDL